MTKKTITFVQEVVVVRNLTMTYEDLCSIREGEEDIDALWQKLIEKAGKHGEIELEREDDGEEDEFEPPGYQEFIADALVEVKEDKEKDRCERCNEVSDDVHVHTFGCIALCYKCAMKDGPQCPKEKHGVGSDDWCEVCWDEDE